MSDEDVSRETNERLGIYSALLEKWNPRINLVSRASLANHRIRHFADSAQLHDLAPHPVDHWADLGSGGGFPGLVIAILALDAGSPARVTLVESDVRKSAFLNTVIRETGVKATVVTGRIEAIPPLKADVLSARALADLTVLLGFADRHLKPGGTALFPKGVTWQDELRDAQSAWQFTSHVVKSKTEAGPVILRVRGISRV
ncbi:16S rRNA (guanine(527)-N(7))-methyltransferase RsmG [Roseovarius autotrophicus]|uniref:16S rRNA (guanine(527)-N(7))-methyltransferase RsmG n=1 Tax=Roseovarius autotrophicus TaxID=2824121 RepID=UPI0019E849AC|nr:16S rRNA (guanine(527)-N(7))-methyltransferase RsmG [Roseovarius autotrophicus]MBE0453435.1 16S rRNA (guanine(527)-N(7))-methyltransferase RsmG [Roseovarius sp.]